MIEWHPTPPPNTWVREFAWWPRQIGNYRVWWEWIEFTTTCLGGTQYNTKWRACRTGQILADETYTMSGW